jgi:hypothetical protein
MISVERTLTLHYGRVENHKLYHSNSVTIYISTLKFHVVISLFAYGFAGEPLFQS